MTHTPGPWRFNPNDGETLESANGTKIAKLSELQFDEDALLIEAAPELLEALRALFQAVPDSDSEPLKAANAQARAALARATGQ